VAPAAALESGFFSDGTEMRVDITAPDDGSAAPGGEVNLAGTARVGGDDTVADTSMVVVMDASNSTTATAGVDCDGNGSNDNIFNCEIAGTSSRSGRFVEVKNTASLYKTPQIKDMIEIATRGNPKADPLVIITRQNTRVSKSLLRTAGVKIVACLPG
jgi:hypothetical protein